MLDEVGTRVKSNDHYWWRQSGCMIRESRSQFSKKLMVSVGVFSNGKTEIFFIDAQKTKVDQSCYIDLLKTSLRPECRRLYRGNDFLFLQDSAPSHGAKVTQQFLRQNNPDFIAADEWASYSSDFNPFDYCILDILQRFCIFTTSWRYINSIIIIIIIIIMYCTSTKAVDFRLQIYRISKMNQKQNYGRRSPLRQFENPLHNGTRT